MKNIITALTIIFCACAFAAQAQDADTAADTSADIAQSDIDSLDVFDSDSAGKPDSLDVKKTGGRDAKKLDSLDDFDNDDDLEIADALADTASVRKLGGVKRGYDRDRQVKLAIVMMVFLVFALGTSQSFNPH